MGDAFDILWSEHRAATIAGMVGLVAIVGVAGSLLLRSNGGGETTPTVAAPPPPPPSAPQTTNWPTYGLDTARTRYLPSDTVKPPFRIGWRYDPGKLMEYSPIVVGDRLYGIDNNGMAFALNAGNGKAVWQKAVASQNASAPTYNDGKLYISNLTPGQVVALNAANGKVAWRHPLPGRTESSPLVVGTTVVVGCECNTVFAFNARTGKQLWSTGVGGAAKASPAYSDGTVYVGDYSGEMTAMHLSNGRVEWRTGTNGSVYAAAAVAFGHVYAGTLSGTMYSFDQATGKVAWSKSTSGYVYSAATAARTADSPPSVYFGSYDGTVYALNASNGNERWSQPANGPVSGAGSMVGDVFYVGDLKTTETYGFRASDGKLVFRYKDGAYNPVISDGQRLYLTGYRIVSQLHPVQGRSVNGFATKSGKKGKG